MAPLSTTCAISANCAPSGRVRGPWKLALRALARSTKGRTPAAACSAIGAGRPAAKGLGVRNADQTDIAAALTQGVNPALNQRSANAVIDDIERSGVLELFTCIVDRTVGPELRHEILATGTSSCDDEGAHVLRELDCEGADAPGSGLYQHALARLELRPLYERLPGRQRDRRKARGFFKGKRSRFASQEANGNNGTLGISTKP